jgi:predicted aconitase with swiveling domain
MRVIIKCRRISRGYGEGYALVSPEPISFFGQIDRVTGVVCDEKHPLYGESIAGKVLVFQSGKGSTVGSYVIYGLAKRGRAPSAMICMEAEPIVAVGAIIAGIPMVDRPEKNIFRNGVFVRVYADRGLIEVLD